MAAVEITRGTVANIVAGVVVVVAVIAYAFGHSSEQLNTVAGFALGYLFGTKTRR